MAVNEFYDSYWLNRRRPSNEWDDARLKKVFFPVIGRSHLLDYGCGIGLTYRSLLREAVGEYSGADVSRVALKTVEEHNSPAYRINPDDSTIDVPDATYDSACSIEVFEHLFDPLAAAKEIYRVLQPGGVLVATVPNFGYHAWRLMALLRAQVPSEPETPKENRHNGVHIRYYSATTFTRLWRDAGFVNVQISSFDDSSIFDITRGMGPFAAISDWARNNLSPVLNLRFLQEIYPSVFAYRIRAVAHKPA